MNNRMKQISQDIRNGKFPEENLPQIFNYMANLYHSYSGIRLAMHYYAFYEAYCDDENEWTKEAIAKILKLNTIIRDNIRKEPNGAERENAIRTIDGLRNDIMKQMNILTAYTDIFQIYEYVLNRVEYRFKDNNPECVDNDDFARSILRYIFDSQDNVVINEKIKEMIGQLPVRMTKERYFDLLKDSIHAYLGAGHSALETYLYMLRTCAMLYHEEGMKEAYPEIWDKKEYLSKLNYKDITAEEYHKAMNTFRTAALKLETETTVYYSLQEVANEVYAVLLCAPYAGMVASGTEQAETAAASAVNFINDRFLKNEKTELPSDVTGLFEMIEGTPEELAGDIAGVEDVLYHAENNYKSLLQSLMLDQMLQVLIRSSKLLSNSIFIDLNEKDEEEEPVDENIIDREAEKLMNELSELFESQDRAVERAVMANTLNKMPVFFKNHTEVMDYVRYSLGRCSDSSEKSACYEIINAIMSE